MSNVLIGIIGVILFIGLALAGALFLGPRFQDSTNNAKAAAAVQAMAQVANAYEMYRVNEGAVPASDADLAPAYIRELPKSPTNGQAAYTGELADGRHVLLPLGTEAESVCRAINRQSYGVDEAPNGRSMPQKKQVGCYKGGTEFFANARI